MNPVLTPHGRGRGWVSFLLLSSILAGLLGPVFRSGKCRCFDVRRKIVNYFSIRYS
jgi:hypothetical protein